MRGKSGRTTRAIMAMATEFVSVPCYLSNAVACCLAVNHTFLYLYARDNNAQNKPRNEEGHGPTRLNRALGGKGLEFA